MVEEEFSGDPTKSVVYNQAMFQQQRIHESFRNINFASLNPLSINPYFGCHNYKVMFNELCNVLSEISPKLSDDELVRIVKVKSTLGEYIRTFSVIKTKKQKIYPYRDEQSTNSEVWFKISDVLFQFQLDLVNLMNKHGFGNPDSKDMKKAMGG